MRIYRTSSLKNRMVQFAITKPDIILFVRKYENEISWQGLVSANAYEEGPERAQDQISNVAAAMFEGLMERMTERDENSILLKPESIDIEGMKNAADPKISAIARTENPNMAARRIAEVVNAARITDLRRWISELNTTYRNSPCFKYIVLKSIMDATKKITGSSGVLPFKGYIVADIRKQITDSKGGDINFIKTYRKSMSPPVNNGWISLPSQKKCKDDPERYGTFEENVDRLVAYGLRSGWCVGGQSTARSYLAPGDFHILLENGDAVVGIRTDKRMIREIAGKNNNSQERNRRYRQVIDFLNGRTDLDYQSNSMYRDLLATAELNAEGKENERLRKVNAANNLNGLLDIESKISRENMNEQIEDAILRKFATMIRPEIARGRVRFNSLWNSSRVWELVVLADRHSNGLIEAALTSQMPLQQWGILSNAARMNPRVARAVASNIATDMGHMSDEVMQIIMSDGEAAGILTRSMSEANQDGMVPRDVEMIINGALAAGGEGADHVIRWASEVFFRPPITMPPHTGSGKEVLGRNRSYVNAAIETMRTGVNALTMSDIFTSIPESHRNSDELINIVIDTFCDEMITAIKLLQSGAITPDIMSRIANNRAMSERFLNNVVGQEQVQEATTPLQIDLIWNLWPPRKKDSLFSAIMRRQSMPLQMIDDSIDLTYEVLNNPDIPPETITWTGKNGNNPWPMWNAIADEERRRAMVPEIVKVIGMFSSSAFYSQPEEFVSTAIRRHAYEVAIIQNAPKIPMNPLSVNIPPSMMRMGQTALTHIIGNAIEADVIDKEILRYCVTNDDSALCGAYVDLAFKPEHIVETRQNLGEEMLNEDMISRMAWAGARRGGDYSRYPDAVGEWVQTHGHVLAAEAIRKAIGRNPEGTGTVIGTLEAEDISRALRNMAGGNIDVFGFLENENHEDEDKRAVANAIREVYFEMEGPRSRIRMEIRRGNFKRAIDSLAEAVDSGDVPIDHAMTLLREESPRLKGWAEEMAMRPPAYTPEYTFGRTQKRLLSDAYGIIHWWDQAGMTDWDDEEENQVNASTWIDRAMLREKFSFRSASYVEQIGYLKKYLEGGVDPYDYIYKLPEFFDQNPDIAPEDFDTDFAEEWIGNAPKEHLDRFIEYCNENPIMIDDPFEAPSYEHMDYRDFVKPTWLIHFTDEPWSIEQKGFAYGHEEPYNLGLTTWKRNRKERPGYNFAFQTDTNDAYDKARTGDYGKHAVVFFGGGVKVRHHGDEEYQIIVWGPSVKKDMIFPIYKIDGEWQVHNAADRIVYSGDFDDAVSWIEKNYRMLQAVRDK